MDRSVEANAKLENAEYQISAATCARAGSLAVYGMADRAIADTLLITVEQVLLVRQTEEFKKAFAAKSQERQQRLMDLEDGWDCVEEKALNAVLENLEYNRDPRYALLAARTANSATRRSPSSAGRVIDATRGSNVIVLSLNQNFVNKSAVAPDAAVLDIVPVPVRTEAARRRVDLPSPKRVAEMLQINRSKSAALTEIEEDCAAAGVDPSLFVE